MVKVAELKEVHWFQTDNGRTAHASNGSRGTKCGQHMGYGNLRTAASYTPKCKRCVKITEKEGLDFGDVTEAE